ncbi:MAG: biotin--[acetyl-CoA-carboxylase] ligase [Ignavibacteriales bacterium CG07_land_8_20_14_0_80_59_12]|nr:MAG: biotin--[acetyl-CoA-carboxylase] ligase [Ignavibacteriales bacterium CG07_land_8_20_14_0_80_59_12]
MAILSFGHSDLVMFSLRKFQSFLESTHAGRPTYVFAAVDSTNSYLRSLALAGASEGTCVLAESQFAGRGRFDRPWYSSPDLNLTFSILLHSPGTLAHPGTLSLIISDAVARSVEETTGRQVETRWPNDVYLNGRKLAGILLERVPAGDELTVAGIGLNVNQTLFPAEIADRATSLKSETGKEIGREGLLARLLLSIERTLADEPAAVLRSWRSRFRFIGHEVTLVVGDRSVTGFVEGIGAEGELLFHDQTGATRRYYAGEIQRVLQ